MRCPYMGVFGLFCVFNESFLPLKHQKEEVVNYSVTGSETTKVIIKEIYLWWSSVKRLCMPNAGGPGSIPESDPTYGK